METARHLWERLPLPRRGTDGGRRWDDATGEQVPAAAASGAPRGFTGTVALVTMERTHDPDGVRGVVAGFGARPGERLLLTLLDRRWGARDFRPTGDTTVVTVESGARFAIAYAIAGAGLEAGDIEVRVSAGPVPADVACPIPLAVSAPAAGAGADVASAVALAVPARDAAPFGDRVERSWWPTDAGRARPTAPAFADAVVFAGPNGACPPPEGFPDHASVHVEGVGNGVAPQTTLYYQVTDAWGTAPLSRVGTIVTDDWGHFAASIAPFDPAASTPGRYRVAVSTDLWFEPGPHTWIGTFRVAPELPPEIALAPRGAASDGFLSLTGTNSGTGTDTESMGDGPNRDSGGPGWPGGTPFPASGLRGRRLGRMGWARPR